VRNQSAPSQVTYTVAQANPTVTFTGGRHGKARSVVGIRWRRHGTSPLAGRHPPAVLLIQQPKIKRCRRKQKAARKKCGPGQPPEPHCTWISCSASVTAERRNDRFDPTALARSAAFAEAGCRSVTLPPPTCNRCGCQQPVPARQEGEEAATPGQPVSRLRAFPECPPAVHSRESPVVAGSAAVIQQAQERPRFAEPNSPADRRRPQQEKSTTLVQKLWTTSLPCGRPRKTKAKNLPRQFRSMKSEAKKPSLPNHRVAPVMNCILCACFPAELRQTAGSSPSLRLGSE